MGIVVEYWLVVSAYFLSPDSVVDAIVQQITDLTPLQVEVIRSGDLIAMLVSANGLIIAEVFVCIQKQTVSDGSSIVHGADNGAWTAHNGGVSTRHCDVLATAVGDVARAPQMSGDSTRM